MSRKEIHYDSKKKKHMYIDTSIRNRGILNGYVANDVRNRNPNWKYNIDDLNRGIEWFESGLSLDDTSVDDRNNEAFVAGFKKGKRIQIVNKQLFELGQEYFDRGFSIGELPDKYRKNEYFLKGYNDRMNSYKSR